MEEYMISMFIDDEMDLDDKIFFVEEIHRDRNLRDETVDLLRQEKHLRAEVIDRIPAVEVREKRRGLFSMMRPAGVFASAFVVAIMVLFFLLPSQKTPTAPFRFVVYQPDVVKAEITGTFTGWVAVPMRRAGSSGYWEITLDLVEGEHRFSYVFEGNRRVADPTIPSREKDDFGGENSVLEVSA